MRDAYRFVSAGGMDHVKDMERIIMVIDNMVDLLMSNQYNKIRKWLVEG